VKSWENMEGKKKKSKPFEKGNINRSENNAYGLFFLNI
jgi:hypothetical protein